MEATNKPQIVRVEIVRDFDKSYYANLYDENGGSHNLSKEYTDFRTLKTLCKKEYGVNLPNLSQIEFETHGRKSYAYISTETPQISTETGETVNGENAAERADIEQNHSDTRIVEDEYRHKYKATRHWLNGRIESIEVWDLDHTSEPPQSPENRPTAADVVQMVKTELAKNKAMGTAWHLEFPDGTECDVRYKNTVAGCDFYDYSERNGKIERFRDYPAVVSDITLYICQALGIDALDAPQSPETPQVIEYTTDTLKPRETARKRQNRAIGSTQQNRCSALGANGYAMLDNASATLAAMYVPRECSTVDAAYW